MNVVLATCRYLERFISRFDANGNGLIEFEEFATIVRVFHATQGDIVGRRAFLLRSLAAAARLVCGAALGAAALGHATLPRLEKFELDGSAALSDRPVALALASAGLVATVALVGKLDAHGVEPRLHSRPDDGGGGGGSVVVAVSPPARRRCFAALGPAFGLLCSPAAAAFPLATLAEAALGTAAAFSGAALALALTPIRGAGAGDDGGDDDVAHARQLRDHALAAGAGAAGPALALALALPRASAFASCAFGVGIAYQVGLDGSLWRCAIVFVHGFPKLSFVAYRVRQMVTAEVQFARGNPDDLQPAVSLVVEVINTAHHVLEAAMRKSK